MSYLFLTQSKYRSRKIEGIAPEQSLYLNIFYSNIPFSLPKQIQRDLNTHWGRGGLKKQTNQLAKGREKPQTFILGPLCTHFYTLYIALLCTFRVLIQLENEYNVCILLALNLLDFCF